MWVHMGTECHTMCENCATQLWRSCGGRGGPNTNKTSMRKWSETHVNWLTSCCHVLNMGNLFGESWGVRLQCRWMLQFSNGTGAWTRSSLCFVNPALWNLWCVDAAIRDAIKKESSLTNFIVCSNIHPIPKITRPKMMPWSVWGNTPNLQFD